VLVSLPASAVPSERGRHGGDLTKACKGDTMDINTLTFAFVIGALAVIGVIVYRKASKLPG
jgi:hypothetical protein